MSDREVSADVASSRTPPVSRSARRSAWLVVLGGVGAWLVATALGWAWPLLAAPATEAVCQHLFGLDAPSATHAAITQEGCVYLVERRLRRRGVGAGARLRLCLGRAKSLEEAATCG